MSYTKRSLTSTSFSCTKTVYTELWTDHVNDRMTRKYSTIFHNAQYATEWNKITATFLSEICVPTGQHPVTRQDHFVDILCASVLNVTSRSTSTQRCLLRTPSVAPSGSKTFMTLKMFILQKVTLILPFSVLECSSVCRNPSTCLLKI